jgi:hypothetical protein
MSTDDAIVPHGDREVVLIGTPSSLRGQITVTNNGQRRQTVRRCRVNGVGDALPPEMKVSGVIASARVEPGAVVTTDIALSLPPSTPPGEHTAEIEVGGVVIEAKVIVAEVLDLEISPAQLVIENRSAPTISKRVAIRNTGNVSITIGEIGPIPLDDELLDCRTLRGALKDLADSSPSVDELVGAVARNAGTTLDQAGILRVHNASGTQTIEPGETQTFDLEVRLPDRIDRHTRYSGEARIYTQNLTFLIVPGRGPGEEPS